MNDRNASFFILVLIASLSVLTSCVTMTSPAISPRTNYVAHGFTFDIPEGFRVDTVERGDYMVYRCLRGNKVFTCFYLGANPDYGALKQTHDPSFHTEMDGGSVRCLSFWKDNRCVGREILFSLQREKEIRFLYVHGWTAKLDSQDLYLAEQILFSLKKGPFDNYLID